MGRTRAELLETMDARELQDHLGLELIYPLDDPWRRSALTTAGVHNAFKGKGKPISPEQFVPAMMKPGDASTTEGQITELFGKRVVDTRKERSTESS